jgi:hypothetical protein
MGNANINLALTETFFTKSMREWKEKLIGKLAQLTTNTKIEVATDNIIHHAINIQKIIGNGYIVSIIPTKNACNHSKPCHVSP